jgi:hypothetical protein
MNDAAWWARVVHARTERDGLRPHRVLALRKDGHEAAIDLKAVPGPSARSSCSRWTASCARRGCSARTNIVRVSATAVTSSACFERKRRA